MKDTSINDHGNQDRLQYRRLARHQPKPSGEASGRKDDVKKGTRHDDRYSEENDEEEDGHLQKGEQEDTRCKGRSGRTQGHETAFQG